MPVVNLTLLNLRAAHCEPPAPPGYRARPRIPSDAAAPDKPARLSQRSLPLPPLRASSPSVPAWVATRNSHLGRLSSSTTPGVCGLVVGSQESYSDSGGFGLRVGSSRWASTPTSSTNPNGKSPPPAVDPPRPLLRSLCPRTAHRAAPRPPGSSRARRSTSPTSSSNPPRGPSPRHQQGFLPHSRHPPPP